MLPADLGVGVDTERVERWRRELPSLAAGPRRRLFTEDEHAYCTSMGDPAQHYAGHWCAKEAVYKAVSTFGRVDLREIEIGHDERGAPRAILPAHAFAGGVPQVRLSITHSTEVAIAFAVAFR